jgi:hypothetical protein
MNVIRARIAILIRLTIAGVIMTLPSSGLSHENYMRIRPIGKFMQTWATWEVGRTRFPGVCRRDRAEFNVQGSRFKVSGSLSASGAFHFER